VIKFMSWLGKRKSSEDGVVCDIIDDTIFHLPPGPATRLGDMSKEQLRDSLFILLSHMKHDEGTISMGKDDKFQRIYLKKEF